MTYMGQKQVPLQNSHALVTAMDMERAKTGMSVRKLSEISGIPYGTLRKIEEFKTVADMEQIKKLSTALHMPMSKLIRKSEQLIEEGDIPQINMDDEDEASKNRTLAKLKNSKRSITELGLAAKKNENKAYEAEYFTDQGA
jgi:transcriptional regulator with XRE-family HTH domain